MDPPQPMAANNTSMASPPNLSHNSPSLSQISQNNQQQINSSMNAVTFQQQQLIQHQQNIMGINGGIGNGINLGISGISNTNFQIPQGMNQIQQQQQQQLQQNQQQKQQQIGLLRQQAALYGQMNFDGSVLNQQLRQQQQQLGNGNLSRSTMIGQGGSLPLLSGQSGAQYNVPSQLLTSPRERGSMLQGAQFQSPSSLGQSVNMQALQMMGLNSQLRANGALPYTQRINQAQLRQQLAQTNTISSPQGQNNLSRTPSLAFMNFQLSGLSQNGQQTKIQNSLTQQQWSMRLPQSPRQLNQPQIGQTSPLTQNMSINPQQVSQVVQQQSSIGQPPQQTRQPPSLLPQLQQQPPQQPPPMNDHQNQELSPRIQGGVGQKSSSLMGLQPDGNTTGTTISGENSSQGIEGMNQLCRKRKIQDLVSQVDAQGKLDPEVEDLLLEIADDFIDSVTTFACNLAKHRKSSTLESKDVLLHLEKNWHLKVPGYSSEDRKSNPDNIRALMESSHSEGYRNNSKEIVRQGFGNLSTGSDIVKPSPNSDQLVSQSTTSQMLPASTRF